MNELKTKNLLVIDDDALVHISYQMALFGSRYSHISIQNVDEAVRYPKSKGNYIKPDLILVDLMLGSANGLDVIKEMREDPFFDKIPIILHTGYAEGVLGEQVIKDLNILYVLPKPCAKQALLKCIDTYIDHFDGVVKQAI